jgi:hypothetical protein
VKGAEAITAPIWAERVSQLSLLMKHPMTTVAIQLAASFDLHWDNAFTANVLAAGEGSAFWSSGSKWGRVGTPVARAPERVRGLKGPVYRGAKRPCPQCRLDFEPRKPKMTYCGSNCRAAAYRDRHRGKGAAA